jgi:hypothetical protein
MGNFGETDDGSVVGRVFSHNFAPAERSGVLLLTGDSHSTGYNASFESNTRF